MLEGTADNTSMSANGVHGDRPRPLSPLNPGPLPDDWEVTSIGSLSHKVTNGFVGSSLPHQVDEPGVTYLQGFNVRPSRIDLKKRTYVTTEFHAANKKSRLKAGDVLVVQSGHIGIVARVPDGFGEANCHALIIVDVDRDALDPDYVVEHLNSTIGQARLRGLHVGSSMLHINTSELAEYEIPVPPLPEQRKIAEILRTWDEAIEKLTALHAAKVRRISSLRQRLFEAEYASHNRLQRAKDLFETVSERARPDLPLLAVMQDIGIVRRDELDRRVAMPDGDTSTYKVVRPGDFVISLRSFEGGLEYSSIIGLVSPAYTVLRPTTDLIGDYYRHFFKSRSFIGRLDKLIFGIRDGKQIAFRDFGDMYIPAPPVAEQEGQARALGSLEADLALEDERIAALTRQKRGLMQKLLTGEWRVSP
jgi:type I restriction enzyme S subunit